MSDSSPEERIIERIRGQPDHYDHVGVVSIPLLYEAGFAVWWLIDVQIHLATGGASLLAMGALVDALFLNPPTPDLFRGRR